MNIVIKRVDESKYCLKIDGDLVESYNQTKMVHPDDWEADADDVGAKINDASDWRFVDDRF